VRDPFKIEGPACISFSGGRSSGYMLNSIIQAHGGTLPPDVVVPFANTGKENEATLEFVRDCAERWSVPIVWLEFTSRAADGFKVVDFASASRHGEPFDRLIEQKQRLPNVVERACTEELKVKTIQRWLNSIGLADADDSTAIGVRCDESRRIAKLRARGRLLPMVDAQISKPHVHAYWHASPFDLALPYEEGHGNCDLCFQKDARMVMARIREKPSKAVWWARKEDQTGGTFHKDRPGYQTMHDFAVNQQSLDLEAGESIPCGFCGD
jgi:hypothetical protein